MAYTPTNWINGTTVANAATLNNIEAGITALDKKSRNVVGVDAVADVQPALDSIRTDGGAVILAPGTYTVSTPWTVWSRCRLLGPTAAPNGCKVQSAASLGTAPIKLGATDGTDPNWHWAEVGFLTVDGNKTNQTTPSSKTVTSATISGQIATITTSTAHGYTIGEQIEFTGFTPAGYNGRYFVVGVTSSTVFTVTLLIAIGSSASVTGTCRRLVNGINLARAGETSRIHNVVVQNCFDDGIAQGALGTPMVYSDVSLFDNGNAGLGLWTDRPVLAIAPSGDRDTGGLIRISGKSSANQGAVGAVTIVGIKSESQTTPAVVIDDYPQGVTLVGGAITMDAANTAACMQRTSASGNGPVNVIGTTFTPFWSGAGNVFQDLSTAAQSVNTPNSSSTNLTFFLSTANSALAGVRLTSRMNSMVDSATPGVNSQSGDYHELTCTAGVGATRTIGAPAGTSGLGQPRVQRLTLRIFNNTGGAITTSWNAAYILAGGAWTDPANNKSRFITFVWNGTNWLEISRSSADT